MAIGTLFGGGTESSGLYGIAAGTGNNPTISNQTYFEWFIFTTSSGTPSTPTGGSWDFSANVGTAPNGWFNFISGVPLNNLWFSVAFVDSRNPTVITWAAPGLISSQSIYATAYADLFTGDGSTVTWTLTQDPVVANNTDISINGVTQVPNVDYTVLGTTLTTTTAVPLDAVLLVKYRLALPLSYYGTASNVQFTPVGTLSSTNVQSAIAEVLTDYALQTGASSIGFTPVGGLSSTNVQSAIEEVITDLALSSGSSMIGYTQGGTGAVATIVQNKLRENVSVLDFGADPTGTVDSYSAIMAAINSLGNNGGVVLFPPGFYLCNTTIELYTQVQLIGANSGQAAQGTSVATKITFPSNTNGIIVQRFNTSGTSGVLSVNKSTGGDGSIICGIQFNGSGTSGNGITLRARAEIINCRIISFGGNGISITAGSDGNPVLGNANSWKIRDCRVSTCLGAGLYVNGTDTNAGYCLGLDINTCGTYGIYESSFLKNAYMGCAVVGCPTANYFSTNYSIFTGCYSESGSGGDPATFGKCLFIGSLIGGGKNPTGETIQLNASIANIAGGYVTLNRPLNISAYNDATKSFAVGVNLSALSYTDSSLFPSGIYVTANSNSSYLDWVVKYGVSSTVYYEFNTGPNTTQKFRRSGPQLYSKLIPKLFVGDGINNSVTTATGLAVASGTAIPTAGRWAQGDVVFNQSAAASGFVGWVCTTGGTMGTLASTTGTITTGTTSLVVNTATGLSVGDQINIAGVSGIKTISAIVETTITISSSASASVTNAAVTFYNAVFKTFGAISA